jgi:hypothetical protein
MNAACIFVLFSIQAVLQGVPKIGRLAPATRNQMTSDLRHMQI